MLIETLPKNELMLAHSLQRLPGINPTLGQCILLEEPWINSVLIVEERVDPKRD